MDTRRIELRSNGSEPFVLPTTPCVLFPKFVTEINRIEQFLLRFLSFFLSS